MWESCSSPDSVMLRTGAWLARHHRYFTRTHRVTCQEDDKSKNKKQTNKQTKTNKQTPHTRARHSFTCQRSQQKRTPHTTHHTPHPTLYTPHQTTDDRRQTTDNPDTTLHHTTLHHTTTPPHHHTTTPPHTTHDTPHTTTPPHSTPQTTPDDRRQTTTDNDRQRTNPQPTTHDTRHHTTPHHTTSHHTTPHHTTAPLHHTTPHPTLAHCLEYHRMAWRPAVSQHKVFWAVRRLLPPLEMAQASLDELAVHGVQRGRVRGSGACHLAHIWVPRNGWAAASPPGRSQ